MNDNDHDDSQALDENATKDDADEGVKQEPAPQTFQVRVRKLELPVRPRGVLAE